VCDRWFVLDELAIGTACVENKCGMNFMILPVCFLK
jgi:hypothetical protein